MWFENSKRQKILGTKTMLENVAKFLNPRKMKQNGGGI